MGKYYIRDHWSALTPPGISKGDYVLATKYRDGDPSDQFCIGFYDRSFDHCATDRHLVIDSEGKQFRLNGFRRVARVGQRRGEWMVKHLAFIESMSAQFSVWHWYRAPWSELNNIHQP